MRSFIFAVTTYIEVKNTFIGRYMNISPGLWFGFSLVVTGSVTAVLAKRRTRDQSLAAIVIVLCIISLALAAVVIVFDQKYLAETQKWLWRKQRYSNDPNPPLDADFNLFHQMLRNKLDIEALFILGACLMGFTVLETITLIISISVAAKFLCDCCAEYAFVPSYRHKPKTRILMVPSKENLRHSLPLLTTEL